MHRSELQSDRTSVRPNVHYLERAATAAAAVWLLSGYLQRRRRENGRGENGTSPRLLDRVAPWAAAALLGRSLTGFCPVYGALRTGTRRVDTRSALAGPRGLHVREAITIARRPHEVFAIWRQLGNLPLFMPHLESVTETDERRSHWVTRASGGLRLKWDAEIIDEVEGEHIGWRSLPGGDVVSAGSVHFKPAPGGQGTEVRVVLQYAPPAGRIGGAIAKLLGDDPSSQIREDLRRFKQWLETGAPPSADRPDEDERQRRRVAGVVAS
jgi:uncharacterized membrane protein